MRRETDETLRDFLVRHNLLDSETADKALDMSASEEAPGYLDVLLSHRYVEEQRLLEALSAEKGWPIEDLDRARPAPDAIALVTREICEKNAVLPLRIASTGELVVAVAESCTPFVLDELRFVANREIRPVLSTERRIRAAIYQAFEAKEGDLTKLLEDLPAEDADIESAPVVRIVDTILSKAAEGAATHIHIDRAQDGLVVRIRKGRETVERQSLPPHMHAPLTSRLKIMANLDIAERRIPQDGRLTLRTGGREFECMVTTLPTQQGERITIRLVELAPKPPTLADMGAPAAVVDAVRRALAAEGGLVLARARDLRRTPALLSAMLAEADRANRLVMAIGDDAAMVLPADVARVVARSDIGFTYSMALRAASRQEADVVALVEMRDLETLDVALDAARRGTVVVGSLHVVDPLTAIQRCLDMGAVPDRLAQSLSLLLFQLPLPRLCERCRRKIDRGFEPVGCVACVRGFQGEAFLYSMLAVNEPVRRLIRAAAPTADLAKAAREAGCPPLADLARPFVESGIIAACDVPSE